MANNDIQVTEQMGDFILWAYEKGEDEIRKMVRECLAEVKAHAEETNNTHKRGEEGWDDSLEPNDGNDQWKHGGDCNLCRKIDYCGTKCRANKLLKRITTPYLYQRFLADVPEAAAKYGGTFNTEQIMKDAGLVQ